MVNDVSEIRASVVDFVTKRVPQERVVCLLAYGSSLARSETPPEDCDFLLLLDAYDESDFDMLKMARGGLPSELFIDYWDQVLRKGFDNYQRGRHGSYFFLCLSTAECLLGENAYALNAGKVSRRSVEHSLLYRIEEYFYRIQKHFLNADDAARDTKMVRKYLSRICMDLLLLSGDMDFSEVHALHYADVVRKRVPESRMFGLELSRMLTDFVDNLHYAEVGVMVGGLYEIYLSQFDAYNRKYGTNENRIQ